ncbi:MAG: hypothetical protein ABJH98_12125 [Reichenbachiella sp.]|uniref:hypothetical protein n=1 Tax=Reichenbachiella sp. TaxID=2184521 RepID=UPI003297117D
MNIKFTNTDAWILMGFPINDEGVSLSELIGRCDAINHAIPTKGEIEIALTKGVQSDIVVQDGNRFKLSNEFVPLYEEVYKSKGGLFAFENLHKKLKKLIINQSNDLRISLSDKEFKLACEEYTEQWTKLLKNKK